MDRIDIHIEVPRVDHLKLTDSRLGEDSATIRERVARARDHGVAVSFPVMFGWTAQTKAYVPAFRPPIV